MYFSVSILFSFGLLAASVIAAPAPVPAPAPLQPCTESSVGPCVSTIRLVTAALSTNMLSEQIFFIDTLVLPAWEAN